MLLLAVFGQQRLGLIEPKRKNNSPVLRPVRDNYTSLQLSPDGQSVAADGIAELLTPRVLVELSRGGIFRADNK